MGRGMLAAALATLVAITLLVGGETEPVQAQGLVIKSIQIIGRKNLDFDTIVENLTLKVGDEIRRNTVTVLEENAQRLYETGYFASKPILDLAPLPDGVMLVIQIEENPPFKEVRLSGNQLIPDDELLSAWDYPQGEVINTKLIEEKLVDFINQTYRDKGIVSAFVSDVRIGAEGDEEGVIFVNILEGKLDQIKVEGNDRTKPRIIRMTMRRVKPDQVIYKRDLLRDMQALQNTGLFTRVDFSLEPSVRQGYVNLIVIVEETRTGQLGFGVGYSTLNGISGTISLRERNWKGEAKDIGGFVEFSARSPGFSLRYTDPYLSEKNSISISLFNTEVLNRRNAGSFYESELIVNSAGGSIIFGHRLANDLVGSIGFSVTDFDYDIISGDPFQGLSPARRAQASRRGTSNSLLFRLTKDTRDNIFSPTQGSYQSLGINFAGFGGDFNFQKYALENRNYFNLGRGTLALRELVGLGTGEVPLFEEFRLGGVNSVRGYQPDEVTGTKTILLNGEYRFPLGETQFRGAVFIDAGWAGQSFDEMRNIVGVGVGIRFTIPALGLGAIRLDYGIGLTGDTKGNRFHFGIGEMF